MLFILVIYVECKSVDIFNLFVEYKQHYCFGEFNDLLKSGNFLTLHTHIIYTSLGSNTFISIILCLLFRLVFREL